MATITQAQASTAGPGFQRVRSIASSRHLAKIGPLALLGVLAYLVLQPLYRLQELALEDNARGYRTAFGSETFAETLGTTVVLALGSLVIAMVLGTTLAFWATRLPRRLGFLKVVPILPIVLPSAANIVAWAFLLSPKPGYLNVLLRKLPWWDHLQEGPVDIYSMPWIVIITGFSLTAFVYLFVSGGLRNINSELIEAAQASGSSSRRVFFTVTLPLLRPVLLYGGGVALLLGLGQFTGPLLLGRNSGVDVITTDMYRSVSQTPIDYAAAAALGSPLLIFGLAVVIMQKALLGDSARFVTHSGKSFRAQTRPSKGAAAGIATFGIVSTGLPLVALLIVALSPFWSGTIDTGSFSLDNFRKALDDNAIKAGISTSLTASILAVLIALPLGFLVANFLLRAKNRVLRPVLDFLVAVPLGIPAVIFGAGFLLTYTRPPLILYGTRWVIVLVYVTLMLPFTTRMQLSGLVSLGTGYVEASRVSGASALRTNLRIVLPLMRGTMASTAALMFVLLTHEFSASMLVRSSTTQVMGTVLYDYWSNGAYPLVAAIALIMSVVTAVGVGLAILVGGSDVLNKL
jgi:iron(III) transport system permease protein